LGVDVALTSRLRLGLTLLGGVPLAGPSDPVLSRPDNFQLTAAASLGWLVF
jgi:hypothetical protein